MNKRSTFWVNIFFSIIFIALMLRRTVFTDETVYNSIGLYSVGLSVLLALWFYVYFKIRNDKIQGEIAQMPVLTATAILIEKIKEDHKSSSGYFLNFELEDGSRRLFYVQREVYSKYLENERGLLSYKQAELTYKHHDGLAYGYKYSEFLNFEKEKIIS